MSYKLSTIVTLLPLLAGMLIAGERRQQDYGNPTEYIFAVPLVEVEGVLRKVRGPNSWGPLAGSYYEESGTYGFGTSDYYTKRYWMGRQEKPEDVSPPEAGRIGTIQCHFTVRLMPKSEKQTLVIVTVDSFEQQVGRRYRIIPHFRKEPIFAKVRTDTYYEYLFLTKLGELLGEKNMPPIKGEGSFDAY